MTRPTLPRIALAAALPLVACHKPAAVAQPASAETLGADEDRVAKAMEFALRGVSFVDRSAEMTRLSNKRLRRAGRTLAMAPQIRVAVLGRADAGTPVLRSGRLARARAEAVRAVLIRAGADPWQVQASSAADPHPIAAQTEPVAWSLDRLIVAHVAQGDPEPMPPADERAWEQASVIPDLPF